MTDSNKILEDLVSGQAAWRPLGGIGKSLAGIRATGMQLLLKSCPLPCRRAVL
jgi:hypothetical protein